MIFPNDEMTLNCTQFTALVQDKYGEATWDVVAIWDAKMTTDSMNALLDCLARSPQRNTLGYKEINFEYWQGLSGKLDSDVL